MTATSTAASSDQAARLRALAGEQLARDRWTRDQLLAYQGERLRALLRHAATASPYYREVLGADAAAGDVPLTELPTLPKPTLMDNFDRIVTDPRLRRAEIEAHLAGEGAGQPILGRYRVFSTAGTTGLRGLFVYDEDEFATWVATCLRGMACWGLTPATRLAGIGSPSPLHLSNQLYAVLLAGRPSGTPRLMVTTPLPEMVTTPLPEMVAALNAYQPEALTAYPSIAAQLAEEQLDGKLGISPTVVGTTSEVLTTDMRRRIHDAWNVDPCDIYGTTEAAVPAASRQHQIGMDILEDLVIVESVDTHNHPVPPGTPGHKLLLTNLVNHVQPLIRDELSDSVTIADGLTPSASRTRASPRWTAAATTSSPSRPPPAARSPSTPSACEPRSPPCQQCASTRSATTSQASTSTWSSAPPPHRTSSNASTPPSPTNFKPPAR
jgi:phenylacetate-coenzyme A ligase PaaK-like adenylate-forming protein